MMASRTTSGNSTDMNPNTPDNIQLIGVFPRVNNVTNDNTNYREIEDYRMQLSKAEAAVFKARRNIRTWYRERRQYALMMIPELFYYLPDMQHQGITYILSYNLYMK